MKPFALPKLQVSYRQVEATGSVSAELVLEIADVPGPIMDLLCSMPERLRPARVDIVGQFGNHAEYALIREPADPDMEPF